MDYVRVRSIRTTRNGPEVGLQYISQVVGESWPTYMINN